MRKMILGCIAIAITLSGYTQDASVTKSNPKLIKEHTSNNEMNEKPVTNYAINEQVLPDGVMMTEGKMILIKKGDEIDMKDYIIMRNGTRVMSNGTIFTKNGTMLMMKEGEHMNMTGRITHMKPLHVK